MIAQNVDIKDYQCRHNEIIKMGMYALNALGLLTFVAQLFDSSSILVKDNYSYKIVDA